jgi:restriction endonuclease Mrr
MHVGKNIKKIREQKSDQMKYVVFLGGLRPGERGVYVSTSGFTSDGKYEGARANNSMMLIDNELLADLNILRSRFFQHNLQAFYQISSLSCKQFHTSITTFHQYFQHVEGLLRVG